MFTIWGVKGYGNNLRAYRRLKPQGETKPEASWWPRWKQTPKMACLVFFFAALYIVVLTSSTFYQTQEIRSSCNCARSFALKVIKLLFSRASIRMWIRWDPKHWKRGLGIFGRGSFLYFEIRKSISKEILNNSNETSKTTRIISYVMHLIGPWY